MASAKGKRSFSVYILPILFCALLIVLVLVQRPARESDSARVLQASEPLTLTDQAIENYLYAAGFVQQGQVLLDGDGGKAADLIVEKDEAGEISAMTLVFPLPTYYETGNGSDVLASLKAAHDEAAQRGEDMFLALFDAIAATDGRVAARRDGALEKLRQAMRTSKAATQSANSWRFEFALEPGMFEGTVTILFTLVK